MADDQATVRVTETWARAATATSSHTRDYFVEAIREMQRKKLAERTVTQPSSNDPVEHAD